MYLSVAMVYKPNRELTTTKLWVCGHCIDSVGGKRFFTMPLFCVNIINGNGRSPNLRLNINILYLAFMFADNIVPDHHPTQ